MPRSASWIPATCCQCCPAERRQGRPATTGRLVQCPSKVAQVTIGQTMPWLGFAAGQQKSSNGAARVDHCRQRTKHKSCVAAGDGNLPLASSSKGQLVPVQSLTALHLWPKLCSWRCRTCLDEAVLCLQLSPVHPVFWNQGSLRWLSARWPCSATARSLPGAAGCGRSGGACSRGGTWAGALRNPRQPCCHACGESILSSPSCPYQ